MENSTELQKQSETRVKFLIESICVLEIDLHECEILGELKPILLENPLLKLQPNFYFSHNGIKIKEFQPLSSQVKNISSTLQININKESFNNRTAAEHVFYCSQFFEEPNKFLYEKFLDFNILIGKTDYLQESITEQELESEVIEFENFVKSDLDVLEKFSFLKSTNSKELFFKQLSYSKLNPPTGSALIQGDLVYLDLITKEDEFLGITINRNGCFSNGLKNDSLNRNPTSKTYLSLLELFSELSCMFEEDLKQFINFSSEETYKKFSQNFQILSSNEVEKKENNWITSEETKNLKISQLRNLQEILKSTHFGQNFRVYRDWNEEFQNCKLLPSSETLQQIHKIKILRKTNEDFLEAAKQLAKAVVEDQIVPLNPSDNKIENCYVFNNLFATFALDTTNWELSKSEVSPTTYSAVNNDINNLNIIYQNDIADVNTINTCVVDYLGHRVIVQTVIQGILHFDQKTWNCYGSIDDGQTMNFNEDFHKIMKNLCDHFSLSTDNQFQDKEGKEYVFHGSPEVKGIKAGDGRKYIMDLMKLSPRDTNYSDPKEHECCVLRVELIKNYLFYQNYEQNYKKTQEELKKKQEEQINKQKTEDEQKTLEKNQSNQEQQNNNQNQNENENQKKEDKKEEQQKEDNKEDQQKEEDKKDIDKKTKAENEQQNKEITNNEITPEQEKEKLDAETKTKIENQFKLVKFNPSLYTLLESKNKNNEEQKEELKKIGDFLKKNMISVFLNNISQSPLLIPMEMKGLVEQLHKNGINLRYLGYIHKLLSNSKNLYLSNLIERTILIRCLRKYFRSLAFDENQDDFLKIVVQDLNIFLGNDFTRKMIMNKIKNANNNQTENKKVVHKNHKKKKNKKKRKKVKMFNFSSLKNVKNLLITPEELLEKIKNIANLRYGFDQENWKNYSDIKFLQSNKDKLSFFREFCLAFGLIVKQKNYQFEASEEKPEYPLKFKDIISLKLHTKNANFYLENLSYNFKTIDQEIQNKNLDNASWIIKGCQQLIINTYGIYNQDFIQTCSKKASVYFLQGKIDLAIKTQLFVVKLYEKVLGLDNHNTALAILELSNYCFEKKQQKDYMKLHSLALYIFDLLGSTLNPNSLYCLHELQLLTERDSNIKDSIYIMEMLLDRNTQLFGQTDERLLYLLTKLAALKANQGLFKEASVLQARHYLIMSRLIKKQPSNLNKKYQDSLSLQLKESERLKKVYVQKSKAILSQNQSNGKQKQS